MLITFETKAYANITMFGDVAIRLIKSMGHSGAVPGAIKADDLPRALEQLHASIQAEMVNEQDPENGQSSEESENYVRIDVRAIPLLEMLEAAIEQSEDVMWDE